MRWAERDGEGRIGDDPQRVKEEPDRAQEENRGLKRHCKGAPIPLEAKQGPSGLLR